ncbi:hypothetical protein JXA32_05855 [Candidatus Sumerlaeota bacterium]|nr:hypothetical protein [Candidatus Sumerlaeota bacterium]
MSLRASILALIALLAAMPRSPLAQAADRTPSADAERVVFVPYEKASGPEWGLDQSVLIPYAEFLKLKNAGADPAAAADFHPAAAIAQATLKGRVEGDVAVFDAEYVIEVMARQDDLLKLRLPFENVSVESVQVEGPQALLSPFTKTSGFQLELLGPERRTLRIRMAAAIHQQGAAQILDFQLPRAAAASMELIVDEDVALEKIPDGLATAMIAPAEEGKFKITASLGSQGHVRLGYRPRVLKTGAAAQKRMAVDQQYQLSVSRQGARAGVKLHVELLSGEIDSFQLTLPEGARLLSVAGDYVKDWKALSEPGAVEVALIESMSEPFEVALDVQYVGAADDGRLNVLELRLPEALRESGTIIVTPDPEVSVWPEQSAGLDEVAPPASSGAMARAYQFSQPGWTLELTRRPKDARVQSSSIVLYEATEDWIRLKSQHRLAIFSRSIFGVSFEVPEGFQLREAGPPELVAGFRQEGRLIELTFNREQSDACEVRLSLQRPREAGEAALQLQPIRVQGAEEDTGGLALAAPLALRVAEVESSGLHGADVRTLQSRIAPLLSPDLTPALGYQFFQPEFEATISIERQRTRISCETSILTSIMPNLLKVHATLNYNIEFSATDELHLRVPASIGEDVVISGADIKERTPMKAPDDRAVPGVLTMWTVKLQRRVIGPYRLHVTFDVPLKEAEQGKPMIVVAPVVSAADVVRETGYAGVSRGENLEVRIAKKADALELRDVKELPGDLASASLGFRYFDPKDFQLELELIRHELESVLGALVRRMHIDTVLTNQREAVHEAVFEVQNNSKQYLELDLPVGMKIWSAFVRGAPVRATKRQEDGAYLIALPKSPSMDEAFRVRLILRETLPGGAMGIFGKLKFDPPQLIQGTIPVLRVTWKLYLPPDYHYVKFRGGMRHETGGSSPWIEPAMEKLLNDLPAGLAGGIAQPALRPNQARVGVAYNLQETNAEREARVQGTALEIPIVREGLQFQFSKLSGTGDIQVAFWKRKPLLLLQGAVGLALLVGLLWWMLRGGGRLRDCLLAAVVLFIAASLMDGLLGRLFATAFGGSAVAVIAGAFIEVQRRAKMAKKDDGLPPSSSPPPPPSSSQADLADGPDGAESIEGADDPITSNDD